MKFAHYLSTIAKDAPDEWQDKFLKYKLLKKLLKPCHSCEAGCEGFSRSEARFFDELRCQLDAANRHFAINANKIIDAFNNQQQPGLCCFLRYKRNNQRKSAELAQRAYWCHKYARANAVALRKILKKHDKCCHNTAGREFLQECWQSDMGSGVGIFLHSPLLDELKAIQDVLRTQLPPEDPDLVERPPTSKAQLQGAARAKEQPAGKAQGKGCSGVASAAEPAGALQQLTVRTATAQEQLGRQSLDGQSQDGSSVDCGVSFTSPSLRQQRQRALSAIAESPTCMLDTADIEWCASPVRGGVSAVAATGGSADLGCGGGGGGGGLQLCVEPHGSVPQSSQGSGNGCSGGGGGGIHGVRAAAATDGVLQEEGAAVGSGFTEEELRCPICLDVMYKPVGLGCGHKFCRQCALEAAGLGRAVGAFHNLISYIPNRTKCPQCRQPGMYKSAVVLREVGKLIQTRYPEEWAERRAEEKSHLSNLAAGFSASQRHVMQSRNAYDLLFSL